MKSEKRDADGQGNGRYVNRGNARKVEQRIEQAGGEIGVFKKCEYADVEEYCECGYELAARCSFAATQPAAETVIDQRGCQQKEDEINLTPRIKDDAHQEKPEISGLCARQQQANRQHNGQEQKQEYW